ncbi:MAG: HNH endonuclease [Anaerolineae bacterium]
MFNPGDVISYLELSVEEKATLQRGMNFHHNPKYSVILMSQRKGAPYIDKIEDDGRLLIYEGHDVPNRKGSSADPKLVDQPMQNPGGSLTQNGLFFQAATRFKNGEQPPELVRVYEKIREGIWVFNGIFELVDAWQEYDARRSVFKFKLHLVLEPASRTMSSSEIELDHTRMIPSSVKREVWERDKGRCANCGSDKNLHFDHILPYSKGGTSLTSANIQLLCVNCNLAKKDRIE